jgi:hypothetical protein
MTKKEFIRRLKAAKKEALRLYPYSYCITDACAHDLGWSVNAMFSEGTRYQNWASLWMQEVQPSRETVAAVFDNSIALARKNEALK